MPPVRVGARFTGLISRQILVLSDTGASSGLGAGIAEYFAKEGAKLSLTGRKEGNLNTVARRCQDLTSDPVLTTVGDIAQHNTRETLVSKTKEKFGKTDILINNAGVLYFSPLYEQPEDYYDELMNVILKAPIFLTKLAVPHLIESKGSIVNVSSISSVVPGENQGVYGISKVGLDTFTKILAREMGPKGVRVNSLNPGFVPTEIIARSNQDSTDEEKLIAAFGKTVPLGRNGTLEDVAKAASFLVSDSAAFITGHILRLDGGIHLLPIF